MRLGPVPFVITRQMSMTTFWVLQLRSLVIRQINLLYSYKNKEDVRVTRYNILRLTDLYHKLQVYTT